MRQRACKLIGVEFNADRDQDRALDDRGFGIMPGEIVLGEQSPGRGHLDQIRGLAYGCDQETPVQQA